MAPFWCYAGKINPPAQNKQQNPRQKIWIRLPRRVHFAGFE
jgi:hypothetical protein